tara:strand:- start:8986 stop:9213 length:228 start_codon:yes stop_codon:yes gene_type:complete
MGNKSNRINGMNAAFYKLVYYPPTGYDFTQNRNETFFERMQKSEEVSNAKTRKTRNGDNIASTARRKKKTRKRKI